MSPIIDSFNFYELSTLRRLTAHEQMRAPAEAFGSPELRAALDRAIAHDKELWREELRWRRRKTYLVEHGEDAQALDRELDTQLSGLESSLRARARLSRSLPESAAEARRCLDALFPDGIGAVVHAPFLEQAKTTEYILEQLRDDPGFLRLIDSLGLSPVLAEIENLNQDYTAAVGAGEKLSREELDARKRKGRELHGEIIARVYGLFPTESEDDAEKRAALMKPIAWQNEVMRAYYKERLRKGPDDTDEPFEDLEEPQSDAA